MKLVNLSLCLVVFISSCVSARKVEAPLTQTERTPTAEQTSAQAPAPSQQEPHFPMAIVGDAGLFGFSQAALKKSILKNKVKSIVLTGDNLYWGSYTGTWDSWKEAGLKFDVMAIGNHHKGYDNEVKYFEAPGEFYSTVKNGARFIVVNSDNQTNLDAQFDWLRKELDQANESLIFLVYHHPTYSTGSDDHWDQRQQFQLRMREIFKDYPSKISALLLGHAHITAMLNFGMIPAIVAGAGREVLKAKTVSYIDNAVPVESLYLAPQVQHWVRLDISDNAEEALLKVIRVSDQAVVCTAHVFSKKQIQLDNDCADSGVK